ncbi:hypothetical protein QL285_087131 [Trifolium repens]|nr:hypothetical protein QL285_087131 [Trifolium repens]
MFGTGFVIFGLVVSSGDPFKVQGLMLNVGLRNSKCCGCKFWFWRDSNMPLAAQFKPHYQRATSEYSWRAGNFWADETRHGELMLASRVELGQDLSFRHGELGIRCSELGQNDLMFLFPKEN